MPRTDDDTAPRRIAAAELQVREHEREKLRGLRNDVTETEQILARIARRRRTMAVCALLALALGAANVGVFYLTDGDARTGRPLYIVLGIAAGLAFLGLLGASFSGTEWDWGNNSKPLVTSIGAEREELERTLVDEREKLRFALAVMAPSLIEQRALYREDVADIIDEYRAGSRTSRRIHNSLQALVMLGATTITVVTAFDNELNWQKITVIAVSASVTLATGFTGYYKFRERGYFLQQTADAIEEEAHAVDLGIGEYAGFEPGQEVQALALFTSRVEALRNEQRRRQQQLDQPAEHATQGYAHQP